MRTKQTGLLALGILLVVGLPACGADRPSTLSTSQTGLAAPGCGRVCLGGYAHQYLDASVAHDPSRVDLPEEVKFTENGREPAAGDALWPAASDPPMGCLTHFADPRTGQVGFNGPMKENGRPALLSFRLKLSNDKRTEIEQIVARDEGQCFGGKARTVPDPVYAETLRPDGRSSREDRITIADRCFKASEQTDGTRPVPFADRCKRLKNGIQTTNPKLFGAPAGGLQIAALSCTERSETGLLRFVTQIRRSRLAAGEKRGMVSSAAMIDHAGGTRSVTPIDGRTVPIGLSSPASLSDKGFFRIKSGKLRRIHAIPTTAPSGMKSGWQPRSDLNFSNSQRNFRCRWLCQFNVT